MAPPVDDPAPLSSRLERLESIQAIQQLANRYTIAADSRNLDALVGLFVDDVDCGRYGTGRDALRASYNVIHRRFYRTIHMVGSHTIDLLDADHATGEVVMRAEHEVGDRWVIVAMCLFDSYERRDGEWFFVRRKPETWYSTEVLERPHGPDWTNGFEGGGDQPRLPHLFPTWQAFWADEGDDVAMLTDYP